MVHRNAAAGSILCALAVVRTALFQTQKGKHKILVWNFYIKSKNAQQKKENSNYTLLSQRKYMINSHMVIHSDELQMYLKRKQMFASD